MKRLLSDETIALSAEPAAIWRLLDDADALGRVLPGCEELHPDGHGRYRGVLEARLAFVHVRADVEADLTERDPPEALTLTLNGRPRGLAGSFRAVLPVRIAASADGSIVHYDLDVEMSGRLATFGAPLLREVMRRQVAALAANIEREIGTSARSGHDA